MFEEIKIKEKIINKIGKEEFEERMKKLKDVYGDVLNEKGLLYLLGKEIGIFEEEKKELKIEDLKENQRVPSITVRIKKIYAPKSYTQGVYRIVEIEDETGNAFLSFWNRELKIIDDLKLESGDKIKIINAKVRGIFKDRPSLSFSKGTRIEILEKAVGERKKIAELEEGEKATVYGKITKSLGVKEIEKEGRKIKIHKFGIGDESGFIWVVAWNEFVDITKNLKEGDVIKIENAYLKNGGYGKELYLSFDSHIIKNPENRPELDDIKNEEFLLDDLKKREEFEGFVSRVFQRNEEKDYISFILDNGEETRRIIYFGEFSPELGVFLRVEGKEGRSENPTIVAEKIEEIERRRMLEKVVNEL